MLKIHDNRVQNNPHSDIKKEEHDILNIIHNKDQIDQDRMRLNNSISNRRKSCIYRFFDMGIKYNDNIQGTSTIEDINAALRSQKNNKSVGRIKPHRKSTTTTEQMDI